MNKYLAEHSFTTNLGVLLFISSFIIMNLSIFVETMSLSIVGGMLNPLIILPVGLVVMVLGGSLMFMGIL